MSEVIITKKLTPQDSKVFDELLWTVLWKPLGFSRDIRKKFSTSENSVEIVAKKHDQIVGGLVYNFYDDNIEIRHIAVDPEFIKQGIGSLLIRKTLNEAAQYNIMKIRTIARNTSSAFFRKIGFITSPGIPPEHSDFTKHNIYFELLEFDFYNNFIFEFNKENINELVELIHHTIVSCYEGIYPARAVEYFLNFHTKEKILKRAELGKIIFIQENNKIIATGGIVKNEIYGLFVHPDYQKQGYGNRIMKSLEKIAKDKQYEKIELSISLTSKHFYEKMGYMIIDNLEIDVGCEQKLLYWSAEKIF